MSEQRSLGEVSQTTEEATSLELGPYSLDLPSAWELTGFSDELNLVNGVNYESKHYCGEGEGRIFLTLNAVKKGGGFKRDSIKHYDGPVDEEKILSTGDLLIANTDLTQEGEVVGYPFQVPEFEGDEREVVPSMDLSILELKTQRFNKTFLQYLFRTNYVHSRLRSFSAGSTVLHLNTDLTEDMSLPVPPNDEQEKIASVLYNVDQAIQKTEALIEQTQRVKKGLIQDLFTEGYYDHEIEHGGWANKCHKKPSSWDVGIAEEIIEISRGAHPRPKSDKTLWGGEIPMIKIGDRNSGDYPYVASTSDAVTEKGSKKSKLVDKGTLIVSNAGTIGRGRIAGMTACIHDHWLILRDYEDVLDTKFLCYFIEWNSNFLNELASGSTVSDLSTNDFALFDIFIPPKEEQEKIVEVIESISANIQKEEKRLMELQRLKKGLMQDLLTGEVRTHDKDIEVLEEVKV